MYLEELEQEGVNIDRLVCKFIARLNEEPDVVTNLETSFAGSRNGERTYQYDQRRTTGCKQKTYICNDFMFKEIANDKIADHSKKWQKYIKTTFKKLELDTKLYTQDANAFSEENGLSL